MEDKPDKQDVISEEATKKLKNDNKSENDNKLDQTNQPHIETTTKKNAEDPGKGLAIASLISAFIIPLLGVVLGFVSKSKSKKAGLKTNGLAIAGIIVGFIGIVLGILVSVYLMVLFLNPIGGDYYDGRWAQQEKDDSKDENIISGERYTIYIPLTLPTKFNSKGELEDDTSDIKIRVVDNEKSQDYLIKIKPSQYEYIKLRATGKLVSEEEDYIIMDAGTTVTRTNILIRLKTEDTISFYSVGGYDDRLGPIFWNGFYVFACTDDRKDGTNHERPWEGGNSTSIYYLNPTTSKQTQIIASSETEDYQIKSLNEDDLTYYKYIFDKSKNKYDDSKKEILTISLKEIIKEWPIDYRAELSNEVSQELTESYLVGKVFRNSTASGETGVFEAGGVLKLSSGRDYAGPDDNRPTSGTGEWSVDETNGSLSISGSGISDGSYRGFRFYRYSGDVFGLSNAYFTSFIVGDSVSKVDGYFDNLQTVFED